MRTRPALVGTVGLIGLMGCEAADPGVLTVAPAEQMGTVLMAEWDGVADSAELRWRTDSGDWEKSPAELGSDGLWRAQAFGLTPVIDVEVRLDWTVDGERSEGEVQVVQTLGLSRNARPLELDESEAGTGLFATGVLGADGGGVVYNGAGEPVWWVDVPDRELYVTRLRPSVDGRTVLVSSLVALVPVDGHPSTIERVAYDGTRVESISVPDGHHDFVELPDGTLAYLGGEFRQPQAVLLRGDLIMEVAPDGATREVWNAWDHYEWTPEDPRFDDQFVHANYLRYDADNDLYWLMLRNVDSLLAIDRSTGEVVEQIGGDHSDFELVNGRAFEHAHGFQWLSESRLLLVDDRRDSDEASRVVEYEVDRTAGTLRQVAEMESDRGHHLNALGDVTELEDGDHLVLWGSSGEAQRVSAEGETEWRGSLPMGRLFGYLNMDFGPNVLPLAQ